MKDLIENEQDAIKQAIEAGFRPFPDFEYGKVRGENEIKDDFEVDQKNKRVHFNRNIWSTDWSFAEVFAEKKFWQALGKARGWESEDVVTNSAEYFAWKDHALRYFETKLSGGSTEDFWKSLP